MSRIRGLPARAGQPDDFPTYVARVRAAQKPKRNLMKLFDGRGW